MGFLRATWLEYTRLVIFATVTVFSIVELAVAGNLTYLTDTYYYYYYGFAALAIATAALSLITLPVMIVFDMMTTDVFTSWIITELVWTGFLWILWLATGAAAANQNNEFMGRYGCGYARYSWYGTACHEFQAIQAFAFLNWILLMVYFIILFFMAVLGASKGGHVWTAAVKAAEFGGLSRASIEAPAARTMASATTAPATMAAQHDTTQYPPAGPHQTV
ncbi:hypothetical protein FISHEDRAFT_76211 [Fistulina hepatica ATCC 64428]|uniref:MARVEL domain-containing protein n=1 Tax=Fistulina hepatica ATCC 64428 TaxID=1128425 RepID=A0A0D7A587_9AGAR|nr:hypothetical protein FISHEDRAFT_76211 [Fistulina hepatica ATCC 64428]